MSEVEESKDILISEFSEHSYVKDAPLGNAGSNRKIRNYVKACVESGVPIDKCKKELSELFKEMEVNDKNLEDVIGSIYKNM